MITWQMCENDLKFEVASFSLAARLVFWVVQSREVSSLCTDGKFNHDQLVSLNKQNEFQTLWFDEGRIACLIEIAGFPHFRWWLYLIQLWTPHLWKYPCLFIDSTKNPWMSSVRNRNKWLNELEYCFEFVEVETRDAANNIIWFIWYPALNIQSSNLHQKFNETLKLMKHTYKKY